MNSTPLAKLVFQGSATMVCFQTFLYKMDREKLQIPLLSPPPPPQPSSPTPTHENGNTQGEYIEGEAKAMVQFGRQHDADIGASERTKVTFIFQRLIIFTHTIMVINIPC